MGSWPKDVGIVALEAIFPPQFVDQGELEAFYGEASGKFTIGLGQRRMGFCTDREDIHSLCLTVVERLLERYGIDYKDIGRLEVGTETIIDKSKSVKTVLMQLFEPHGVTDLEGVDCTNACYGGTAALFNAVSWVESSAWNGRYALVVTADIAVYAKGPARPTGGAGAVAILVGPDAPLVFDRGLRSTYVRHMYDFYKPDLSQEYPVVDGKLSIQCYLSAVDKCYQLYCKNASKKFGVDVNLNYFDAVVFHSPYCKLVQKSLARLSLNDFVAIPKDKRSKQVPQLANFENVSLSNTYFDRDVEKAFMGHSKGIFEKKTSPSLYVANQVGNMYTASLYGGLVSLLISKDISELAGNKIGLFSYGSGFVASFFSITVTKDCNEASRLHKLVTNLQHVKTTLQLRQKVSPEKYESNIEAHEKNLHKVPYRPSSAVDHFLPGTYYLTKIDECHRRFYDRIPLVANGHV